MKIGIIIQARMGSTRLPGKVLLPFYGEKTLLEVLLDKLHTAFSGKIIVATSIKENNDELERFLKNKGEIVFRGSENDVLNRFIEAAKANGVDAVVRICSDNPFMDVNGVMQLVEKGLSCDADYVGFRINNKPSILTHFGFWGEFVTLDALMRVAASTPIDTPAHEHVTFHIYNHPEEYHCEWIKAPDFLQNRDDIRLTIDTPEDMNNARSVYADLMKANPDFSLKDVVDYLDAHESLKQSMLKNISQNKK